MEARSRFSWESSESEREVSTPDHVGDQTLPTELERPAHCELTTAAAKGKAPEQSTARYYAQSAIQTTTQAGESMVNNVCQTIVPGPSYQNRNQVPAVTGRGPAPAMFIYPPTPINTSVRKATRRPSPLSNETYKHASEMGSDEPLYGDVGSAPLRAGRQLRFDSAVDKNEIPGHTDNTSNDNALLAHTYTWPNHGVRQGSLAVSPLSTYSTSNSAGVSSGKGAYGDGPSATNKMNDDRSLIGAWYCCECDEVHAVFPHVEEPHITTQLGCECGHRPCQDCEFSGYIKIYCPVDEMPATVHISDETIKFGVICRECGLSWRAQQIKNSSKMRHVWNKLSVLPKRLNRTPSMMKLRQASASMINLHRPESSLAKTRSVANLRSASDPKKGSEESDKEIEEQATSAKVRFFGIVCTCGRVTEPESVCFQITDVPWGTPEADLERKKAEIRRRIGITTRPEYTSKGHRDPVIHLLGGSHPNPLLSCPVEELRRLELYMGGQQAPGEPVDDLSDYGSDTRYMARRL